MLTNQLYDIYVPHQTPWITQNHKDPNNCHTQLSRQLRPEGANSTIPTHTNSFGCHTLRQRRDSDALRANKPAPNRSNPSSIDRVTELELTPETRSQREERIGLGQRWDRARSRARHHDATSSKLFSRSSSRQAAHALPSALKGPRSVLAHPQRPNPSAASSCLQTSA